jgi:glycosyltransferase involved in cell wall biosynthesis
MCFAAPSVLDPGPGGIPEVVEDNVSGVLVPAGDAGALANALEALIHDRPRRRALGRAHGRARASSFSAESSCRATSLYRRLCR